MGMTTPAPPCTKKRLVRSGERKFWPFRFPREGRFIFRRDIEKEFVTTIAGDQLEPDRHAIGVVAGGERDRRMAARIHPGREDCMCRWCDGLSGDDGRIWLFGRPG